MAIVDEMRRMEGTRIRELYREIEEEVLRSQRGLGMSPPIYYPAAEAKEEELAALQAREEQQRIAEEERWDKRDVELAAIEVDRSKPFIGAGDVRWMLQGRRAQ